MHLQKTSKLKRKNSSSIIMLKFIIVFVISLLTSISLSYKLWPQETAIFHTCFELACIFIALSSFTVVWLTHNLNKHSNIVIGYGFLVVAIFDIFHTFFFPALNLYPAHQYDLSTKFWVLGRLAEALVILFSAAGLFSMRLSRWKCLLISFSIPLSISLIVISFPEIMPVLFTPAGVTKPKIAAECIIILILIASFYFLHKKINRRSILTYKYIYISILILIPSELCFTLFRSITSFLNVFGHTLRILSYFYLFRGIFASAVTFPYLALEKSKQKLIDSKNELKEILNGLPLGIVTYEDGQKVSFANKKALELFECSSNDVLGLTPSQFTEQFSTENESITSVFEDVSNDTFNSVRDYITLKGNIAKLNAGVIKYKHGVLVSLNDVKKEQELNSLKIQTRTILNSISNLVLMTDNDYSIIMLNKAFTDCIEMEEEDVLGMSLVDLGHRLHINSDILQDVISKHKQKVSSTSEARIITPKSNKKDLLIHSSPIIDLEKREIGHIVVCSDITELKNEQTKLLRQEKLALIGQMGSGIVHETKNHLASIKGYCQLLSFKISDRRLINYIERIETITSDVNKVIVDFLSMAKPSETVMDITSLNEILESMSYMIESPSFLKGVEVKINLSDEDADIKVDDSQIKQVVLNMAKNAIEAMSGIENPKLVLTTRIDNIHNLAILDIADNGTGISEENLKMLGTPFFTTKGNGTGLGLSTCYRIINEHGGKIDVCSVIGKGTTFTISIPLYDSES